LCFIFVLKQKWNTWYENKHETWKWNKKHETQNTKHKTWRWNLKHKTWNMKCETLRIALSLVWLFAFCAFLLPFVLFYCARRNNKECRPLPSLIFIFIPFRRVMNIVLSPPFIWYSFSPSCTLHVFPFLLLLCLCKEEWGGVGKSVARPSHH
jgi:hypothetical protein